MSQPCCSLDAPKNEFQLAGSQVCQRKEESAGAGIALPWPWMVSGRREERENHRGISKGLMLHGAEGCVQPNEGIYVASYESENPF